MPFREDETALPLVPRHVARISVTSVSQDGTSLYTFIVFVFLFVLAFLLSMRAHSFHFFFPLRLPLSGRSLLLVLRFPASDGRKSVVAYEKRVVRRRVARAFCCAQWKPAPEISRPPSRIDDFELSWTFLAFFVFVFVFVFLDVLIPCSLFHATNERAQSDRSILSLPECCLKAQEAC